MGGALGAYFRGGNFPHGLHLPVDNFGFLHVKNTVNVGVKSQPALGLYGAASGRYRSGGNGRWAERMSRRGRGGGKRHLLGRCRGGYQRGLAGLVFFGQFLRRIALVVVIYFNGYDLRHVNIDHAFVGLQGHVKFVQIQNHAYNLRAAF